MANPFRSPIQRILDEMERAGSRRRNDSRISSKDLSAFIGGFTGFAEAFSPDGWYDDHDLEGIGIDRDEPFYEVEGDGLISNIRGEPIVDFWGGDINREEAIWFATKAELTVGKGKICLI